MEDATEVHFRPLRPYCMALTTQPALPVLKKLNDVVEHEPTPSILGMVRKVEHLVEVDSVD